MVSSDRPSHPTIKSLIAIRSCKPNISCSKMTVKLVGKPLTIINLPIMQIFSQTLQDVGQWYIISQWQNRTLFINILNVRYLNLSICLKGKRYLTHRYPIHLNDNQNFSAIYRCVCKNI
jgi:hypothetical protein